MGTFVFSAIMFLAVGAAGGYLANKVTEGGMAFDAATALSVAGALSGGLGALSVGMEFYGVLGQMVVAGACALLCLLIWRQLEAAP